MMLPHTVRLTVHAQLNIEAKHSFELLILPAYFYVKMCKMQVGWQVWVFHDDILTISHRIFRHYGYDGLTLDPWGEGYTHGDCLI